jgi:hypothetical protein
MSQTKIESLTPEQEACLVSYRDEMVAYGRSCEPADRAAAEQVWREMYATLGKPAPVVMWWDGPATGTMARALLEANLGNDPRANLWADLGANLGANLRANLEDNLGDNLTWSFWGAHEIAWPAFYAWPDLHLRPMHTDEQRKRLNWWLTLSKSTGWWIAYEGVVMACERPLRQAVDENGHLHHETEAAFICRDGWQFHAWHGIRVPARVIEQPETLTAAEVLAEANAEVRRVMIERMGDRFWHEAEATQLDADTDGAGQSRKLLSIPLANDPEGAMVGVHVTCPSTGHEYILRVPPTVRTCTEAVAWTFGLDVKEYAPAVES